MSGLWGNICLRRFNSERRIRRPYGGRVEGPFHANEMKSITQINLARLTVRKSLSQTDSAQLHPPPLITVGGAVHGATLTFLRRSATTTLNSL